MEKTKKKDKPQYSVNLEVLIKEQGITKTALADRVHTSVQTISKACNGVRLTKYMAKSIIEEFPEYNEGWLLGYSNLKYKHDVDKLFLEEAEKHQQARQHEETVFDTIARLAVDVGFNTYFDGSVMTIEPSEELEKQGYKPVALTFRNGKLLELQEDIEAFMKYRFETIIRRGQK